MSGLGRTVVSFISSQHIMTIASTNGKSAWSAPVYYLFDQGIFFFFSKNSSRHIREGLSVGSCSVSIHAPSKGWQDIKGIQMEGDIAEAGSGEKSKRAFRLYKERFSFIGLIRSALDTDSLRIDVIEKMFNARWYAFTPHTILYTDNSTGFGHRLAIPLHDICANCR